MQFAAGEFKNWMQQHDHGGGVPGHAIRPRATTAGRWRGTAVGTRRGRGAMMLVGDGSGWRSPVHPGQQASARRSPCWASSSASGAVIAVVALGTGAQKAVEERINAARGRTSSTSRRDR